MSPEAQHEAIAVACGYERRPDGFWREKGMIGSCGTPDYLNDLNAMHEAEQSLEPWQHEIFRDQLARLVAPHPNWERSAYHMLRPYVSATATQRAEAFLRCLNLWTDEP